jgi:hypothetical protein
MYLTYVNIDETAVIIAHVPFQTSRKLIPTFVIF